VSSNTSSSNTVKISRKYIKEKGLNKKEEEWFESRSLSLS
jgi:hypothetical protein